MKSKARHQPGTRNANSNRRRNGDIQVASTAGDVRKVPGSGTTNGDKAIADITHGALERVRRVIRARAIRRSDA